MQIFLQIIIGLTAGLLGGMGMGGGTLLIPLLTVALGMNQHVAQGINLIAFIPMSVAALVIHIKNKLVGFRYLLTVALPAAIAGAAASYLVKFVGGKALNRYFGIFLAALGVYQLTAIIVDFLKNRKKHAKEYLQDEQNKV
jgi:uncharacterized membrane protein YfcA